MKYLLNLVDDGISQALGFDEPVFVAGDDFLEFMAEFGVLDDVIDIGDFVDAWETFLREECDTL